MPIMADICCAYAWIQFDEIINAAKTTARPMP
jgi:hypothetical protein